MCSTGKVATFLLKQNPAPRALVLLAAVSEALLGYVSSRCVWFPPRWDVDHPIIHLLWLESQPGKRRAPCDLESTPKSMRHVESGEICWQVTPARCTRRVLRAPTHPPTLAFMVPPRGTRGMAGRANPRDRASVLKLGWGEEESACATPSESQLSVA